MEIVSLIVTLLIAQSFVTAVVASNVAPLPVLRKPTTDGALFRIAQTHLKAREKITLSGELPTYVSGDDIMHGYSEHMTTAEREELLVTRIELADLKLDVKERMVRWRTAHYNHSDHLLALTDSALYLWKVSGSTTALQPSRALFSYKVPKAEKLVDAIAFVRVEDFIPVFYVVFLTGAKFGVGAKLHAYQVDDEGQASLLEIPLSRTPVQVQWLESQRDGALVLLYSSEHESRKDYRQGKSAMSHVYELDIPNAVSMATGSVLGYGYVVVSNSTTVVVYKADEFANTLYMFDEISLGTSEISDVSMFRVGFESLLAIAGPKEQRIYTWQRTAFSLRQTFHISDGLQWHPLSLGSSRDDVLLAMSTGDFKKPIILFGWSSSERSFRVLAPAQNPLSGFVPLYHSMASYSHGRSGNIWLLLTDSVKGKSYLVAFATQIKFLPNPIYERGIKMVEKMQRLKSLLDNQQSVLQKAETTLAKAVSAMNPLITFPTNGSTMLQQLVVNGRIIVSRARDVTVAFDQSGVDPRELSQRLPVVRQAVNDALFRFKQLHVALQDVVYRNASAVITAPKRFTGHVIMPKLQTSDLVVDRWRRRDVNKILESLYWLNVGGVITAPAKFTAGLTITRNVNTPILNNAAVKDIVKINEQQQILRGMYTFSHPLEIKGKSEMLGKLNGVYTKDMVTLKGSHHILAPKHFDNIQVEQITAPTLGSYELATLAKQTLDTFSDQMISGLTRFSTDLVSSKVYTPAVNGRFLGNLETRFVRKNRPTVLLGRKIIDGGVTFNGSIRVGGRVDNLRIPTDLVLKDVEQVITGRKQFSTLKAGIATVKGRVNGFKLPGDLMSLTKAQHVRSHLRFERGIAVGGDIAVGGTVDGVDISEFAKHMRSLPAHVIRSDAKFKGPVTIEEHFDSEGLINGQNVEYLFNNAIFPSEAAHPGSVLRMRGPKNFMRHLNVSELTVKGRINGFNLATDFVAADDHHEIEGTVVFKGPVTFEKNLTSRTGIVDGVPLQSALQSRISLHLPQRLGSVPPFDGELVVDDLFVGGTIAGVKVPDELVLKGKRQRIRGVKVVAGHLDTEGVEMRGPILGRMVNGYDWVKLFKARVPLDPPPVIQGDIMIANARTPFVDARTVDGGNLLRNAHNVMLRRIPQIVTAPKYFIGNVSIYGPIMTRHGVNGYSLRKMAAHSIRLRGLTRIPHDLIFGDTLTVLGDVDTGALNGVNVGAFAVDCVPSQGPVSVRGPTEFLKGFWVRGNIITPTVNDFYLPNDVLLKSLDQRIPVRFQFAAPFVRFESNIEHSGTVNGIDLSEFELSIARKDRQNVIESKMVFKRAMHVSSDVEIGGLVNGVKIGKLMDSSICRPEHHIVLGKKRITGPVTFLNSLKVGRWNRVPFSKFVQDVVFIGPGHYEVQPKTFVGAVQLDEGLKTNKAIFHGRINGILVKKVIADAVYLNGPCHVTGLKVFAAPVEIEHDLNVKGTINGVRIPEDVIRLCHRPPCPIQQLTSPTFENLRVTGDLDVGGTVNGFRMQDLVRDALNIYDNQTFNGGLDRLQKPVDFHGSVAAQRVNGMNNFGPQSVIPLDGKQTIAAPIIWDDVRTPGIIVDGPVNGMNLKNLTQNAIYLDRPQTLKGPINLKEGHIRHDFHLKGKLNGREMAALRAEADKWNEETTRITQSLHNQMVWHQRMLDQLTCFIKSSHALVDYFELHQSLDKEAISIDAASNVGYMRLIDSHIGQEQALTYHLEWNRRERRWSLTHRVTSDEGKRVYFALQRHLYWIEEPLQAARRKRALLTDGDKVLYTFQDVKSIAATRISASAAVIGSLNSYGSCDLFRFKPDTEVRKTGPIMEFMGGIYAHTDAESLHLVHFEGITYAIISHYTPQQCVTESLRSSVHAWEGATEWGFVQTLHGGSVISSFERAGYLHVLVMDVDVDNRCSAPSIVKVYRSCHDQKYPFELFQVIRMKSVTTLQTFHYGAVKETYLILANSTMIQLFAFQGEGGFRPVTDMFMSGVSDVTAIAIDSVLYLAVARGHTAPVVVFRAITTGIRDPFQQHYLQPPLTVPKL